MLPAELTKRYRDLRDQCPLRLTGLPPQSMRQQLTAIAEFADQYQQQDYYGEGELIESFEREISTLLGMEATVFLPSGTMAQCIALRIWDDRSAATCVGFHASSHLELHEPHRFAGPGATSGPCSPTCWRLAPVWPGILAPSPRQ